VVVMVAAAGGPADGFSDTNRGAGVWMEEQRQLWRLYDRGHLAF